MLWRVRHLRKIEKKNRKRGDDSSCSIEDIELTDVLIFVYIFGWSTSPCKWYVRSQFVITTRSEWRQSTFFWCSVPKKRAAVNDHTRNYLSWTPIHVHHRHTTTPLLMRERCSAWAARSTAIKHLIQRSRPQSDIVCVCVGRGPQEVATWVAGCTAKKFFYKKDRKMSGPESSMYKYSWRHRNCSIRQMLRNMMLSRSISLVEWFEQKQQRQHDNPCNYMTSQNAIDQISSTRSRV